jgi:hypothetical protein
MSLETILKTASSVRKTIEDERKKNHDAKVVWSQDLCGACAVASSLLTHELKKQGVNSFLVIGQYIRGDVPWTHCWVETNSDIIDITATQFGIEQKVFLSDKRNSAYKRDFFGKAASKEVTQWYGYQNPTKFPHLFK